MRRASCFRSASTCVRTSTASRSVKGERSRMYPTPLAMRRTRAAEAAAAGLHGNQTSSSGSRGRTQRSRIRKPFCRCVFVCAVGGEQGEMRLLSSLLVRGEELHYYLNSAVKRFPGCRWSHERARARAYVSSSKAVHRDIVR